VYDDAFWESLDGVVNALDNVKARQYVDARSVAPTRHPLAWAAACLRFSWCGRKQLVRSGLGSQ
jgi:hypothetical protein